MFYILHLKSFQIFYWIHFMEVFHSYPTSVRMHLHKFRYCHWNRKPDLFFFRSWENECDWSNQQEWPELYHSEMFHILEISTCPIFKLFQRFCNFANDININYLREDLTQTQNCLDCGMHEKLLIWWNQKSKLNFFKCHIKAIECKLAVIFLLLFV